ncbi:MAG: hypothetical protein LBT23_04725 [Synergistaceae bacterium]|nr:hypothetical protein [Synergistaceae bacterium]
MKNSRGASDKLFAVSAYSRAAGGDFTGRARVSVSRGDVMTNALASDAALKGILASLRRMREICLRFANAGARDEERKSAQDELDILKENISRLSEFAEGTKFLVMSGAGGKLGELEKIDESIDRVSLMCETPPEPDNDEKIAGWMKSVLGN